MDTHRHMRLTPLGLASLCPLPCLSHNHYQWKNIGSRTHPRLHRHEHESTQESNDDHDGESGLVWWTIIIINRFNVMIGEGRLLLLPFLLAAFQSKPFTRKKRKKKRPNKIFEERTRTTRLKNWPGIEWERKKNWKSPPDSKARVSKLTRLF